MQVWYSILVLVFMVVVWVMPLNEARAEQTLPVNATAEIEPSYLGQSFDADAISAEKISQFVQVYLQVLNLIEQRENDLQGAELDSESQQIQLEIETQAVALIQSSGLTLQEYLQLLSLTNIDPEFGERVAAQLQEATN
jgi:Domain of unknown function (DUF4168)